MPREASKGKIYKVVTAIVAVAILVCAVYIMAVSAGLDSRFDFGAGAYYYADIPDFDKVVRDGAYTTKVPYWVHVVLSLSWGWLMYRLWVWVDSKK